LTKSTEKFNLAPFEISVTKLVLTCRSRKALSNDVSLFVFNKKPVIFWSWYLKLHYRVNIQNLIINNKFWKSLTGREMQRKNGLEEAEIQKLHTTAPEHLTDDELLLSTFCAEDLARKHSGGWDNDHPKCLFCGEDTGSGLLPPSVT
jgi:hypothetical protein